MMTGLVTKNHALMYYGAVKDEVNRNVTTVSREAVSYVCENCSSYNATESLIINGQQILNVVIFSTLILFSILLIISLIHIYLNKKN